DLPSDSLRVVSQSTPFFCRPETALNCILVGTTPALRVALRASTPPNQQATLVRHISTVLEGLTGGIEHDTSPEVALRVIAGGATVELIDELTYAVPPHAVYTLLHYR